MRTTERAFPRRLTEYTETTGNARFSTWLREGAEPSCSTAVERGPHPRFSLEEWVDLHANDGFAEFVSWLRRELDEAGAARGSRRRLRLEPLFRRTVSLEADFFEMGYEPDTQGHRTGGDPEG